MLFRSIIDPYYDWYMDDLTFNNFIIKKYGSFQKAQSKIKNFQNNWYSDPNPISVSTYQSLLPELKRYYQPNFGSNTYNTSPLAYTRRQENWEVSTNMVLQFSATYTIKPIEDEITNIYLNNEFMGSGQVCFANTSTIYLQHISGSLDYLFTEGQKYLYGTESGSNTQFTSSTILSSAIPLTETTYWSPVTYYDYETAKNDYNRSILVLNNKYASQAVQQLANLV